MKTLVVGLILLGFAGSTLAINKAELDHRIRTLTGKFETLQQKPDKCIPADTLRKAQGVVFLDRTKAGFLFAYQGGSGVALVKDAKTEKWSPVAFLSGNEASLGFQVGGQQSFFVILFMNTNATRLLTEPNIEFGGEARGTAGDATAGVEGKVSSPEEPVLVFDDRKGLYGGAAIKGGAVSPDNEANRIYYEQVVTMHDILFERKVKPTEAATAVAAKLAEYSKLSEHSSKTQ
jgi:lipid-binding SYLF domain-containing protein